jgi:hypothetical protein
VTLQGSGSKRKGGLKAPKAKSMKKGMKGGGMMTKGKGKAGTGISSTCPEEFPGIQTTSTNNSFFGSSCEFGEICCDAVIKNDAGECVENTSICDVNPDFDLCTWGCAAQQVFVSLEIQSALRHKEQKCSRRCDEDSPLYESQPSNKISYVDVLGSKVLAFFAVIPRTLAR